MASRIEQQLTDKINGLPQSIEPKSRMEVLMGQLLDAVVDKGEGFYKCYITGGSVEGKLEVSKPNDWTLLTPSNTTQTFYYEGIGYGINGNTPVFDTSYSNGTSYYVFNTQQKSFKLIKNQEPTENDIVIVKSTTQPPGTNGVSNPVITDYTVYEFEPTKSVPTMTEAVLDYKTRDVSSQISSITAQQIGSGTVISANVNDSQIATIQTGSWTPQLKGETTDPTVTYSRQIGTYVKIGKWVYLEGTIWASAYSGGSGTLRLGGLPFTPKSSAIDGSLFYANVNSSTGTDIKVHEATGSQFILYEKRGLGNYEHLNATNIALRGNLLAMQIGLIYKIN